MPLARRVRASRAASPILFPERRCGSPRDNPRQTRKQNKTSCTLQQSRKILGPSSSATRRYRRDPRAGVRIIAAAQFAPNDLTSGASRGWAACASHGRDDRAQLLNIRKALRGMRATRYRTGVRSPPEVARKITAVWRSDGSETRRPTLRPSKPSSAPPVPLPETQPRTPPQRPPLVRVLFFAGFDRTRSQLRAKTRAAPQWWRGTPHRRLPFSTLQDDDHRALAPSQPQPAAPSKAHPPSPRRRLTQSSGHRPEPTPPPKHATRPH